MTTFYEKYRKTIRQVSQRNYRARIIWVHEYLADKCCKYCGEPETACLKFYPYDMHIRRLTKRKGLNPNSRSEVMDLIKESEIVCANCYLKLENDLIDIM